MVIIPCVHIKSSRYIKGVLHYLCVCILLTDESPVMLESESRYLPVLTDAVSVCSDSNLPSNMQFGGVTSQAAASSEAVREHSKPKKLSSERGGGKPMMRRIAANFSKSSSDFNSAMNPAVKSADNTKSRSTQPEIESATVSSGHTDSRKQISVPSDHTKLSSAQPALSVDIIKCLPVSNDSKTGLVMSPSQSQSRHKSQPRTDSSPLSHSGESRRLLKGVMKKSPGRRDEPGILLATSSSLYTPEKYRNTMRQIFGESSTDEDKLLKHEPSNQSQQQRTHSNIDSKYNTCKQMYKLVCSPFKIVLMKSNVKQLYLNFEF